MAGICRICNRISATGSDHTDCMQRRRMEMEDEHAKSGILERLDAEKDMGDLGAEIRAILEHLEREKSGSEKRR